MSMLKLKLYADTTDGVYGRNDRRIGRSIILLTLLFLLLACPVMADTKANPNFWAVGKTKQYNIGSSKIGLGTCNLISKKWALTAWHVASQFNDKDTGRMDLVFRGAACTRRALKVYKAPNGLDIALIKLNSPVYESHGVYRLALNKNLITNTISGWTMVGRSGGLHYHRMGSLEQSNRHHLRSWCRSC